MQRRFTHAPEPKEGEHQLAGYAPLLTRLLINRGITTEEAAERYLRPSYTRDMHDPFLMHDMEKAVVRLFEAVEAKEKIVVYADYDCDGIPGAVILYDLLQKIGCENFSVYIPDRHEEGYGLNTEAIEQFIENEVKLVVTIDLGTSDHECIAQAMANGIDVVVTDHHLPHETLPNAYAIVNPKLGHAVGTDLPADASMQYPEPMLCGSGVMFKLVQAFLLKYGEYYKVGAGWEKWLLDMAGLATLSDMVPLVGENRTIASFGMQVFRKSPRPGVVSLLRKLKINQRFLVEDDLTFMVTPRINAASRMDSPMRAFELLSERDEVKANALADHLTSINDERKRIVATIMKEVNHTLTERELGPIIVVGSPKWRVGVLGIVAGKIMEEFDRPVFVWGGEGMLHEEGSMRVWKGSCRSNGTVNVVALMEAARDHFADYGGHELAGGFSISGEQVHFLEAKLVALFDTHQRESITAGAMIDAVLSLSDVSQKTCDMISSLAPFGLGNPKPAFLFPNVEIRAVKLFGKEKNHLEITVADTTGERTAMAFFAGADTFTRSVVVGERVDLIATMEESRFAGRVTVRLRILDIQ